MEVDSSKADQEDLVVKSMLGDDGYAHDGSLEMFNEYWNNIDDWTDTSKIGTGVGAEYYDFAPNHKEMHQECLNFDDWFNAEKPLYEIYPMLSEKCQNFGQRKV